MSTTDDTTSTSTPDATLDPATVAEVEQALDGVQGGGVAQPNGGIGHAETVQPVALVQPATGGIGHPEDPQPGPVPPTADGGIGHPEGPKPDGIAKPHGGIGHAEVVH
ncbi:hypothetical protein [Kutzneria sp. NPDC052558]|uniref:hypothetical protein n=1 Tax=Kutzneria sp. NPDC052558 TaxID=3364121 RepID=UPI0037C6832D